MSDLKHRYQCCLCGEAISQSAVDPCAIVIIGNWAASESEQASQQFWCHVVCFRRALRDDRHVEIEELVADVVRKPEDPRRSEPSDGATGSGT
jgi:hypothetical protein